MAISYAESVRSLTRKSRKNTNLVKLPPQTLTTTNISDIEVCIPDNSGTEHVFIAHCLNTIKHGEFTTEISEILTDLDAPRLRALHEEVLKMVHLKGKDYMDTSDDFLVRKLEPYLTNFITPAASKFAHFEKTAPGILHHLDHYTAFICGETLVLAFETLPTRVRVTIEALSHLKKPVFVVSMPDQTKLPIRNACGPLSIVTLLGPNPYVEDILDYAFDQRLPELENISSEDEGELFEDNCELEETFVFEKQEKLVETDNDYSSTGNLKVEFKKTDGKYSVASFRKGKEQPSKIGQASRITVEDPKDVIKSSNASSMAKLTAFAQFLGETIRDIFPTDFQAGIYLSTLSIVASLIALFSILRDRVNHAKTLTIVMLANIAFQIINIITLCDKMKFSFIESVESIVQVFNFLTPNNIFGNPRGFKLEELVKTDPETAQLAQYRDHYKQIKTDDELYTFLRRFESRLLTRRELRVVRKFDLGASLQFDSDFLVFLAEKALYPIALVISICGISGPAVSRKWIRDLRTIIAKSKEDFKTISSIKESLLEFFVPEKSHSQLIVRQREANMLAVQPAIPEIVVDQSKYAELLRCSLESKNLYNGVMARDGKNEIYKNFTHSASLVENKLFDLKKVIQSGFGKQEPVAVHFYGELGIGKTTFILRTLVQDLAKRLNVPSTTFNARINSDGFYSLYGGQTFAYMDEVGDRSDSSGVYDLINEVVSTSTVNMPSAFVKDQPFLSRFLFCISNYSLADAVATSLKKPESATALRSRFISIEMRNPAVDTNQVRGANPAWFDKDNFEFYNHENSLKGSGKKEGTPISYENLLFLLERSYYTKLEAYQKHVAGLSAFTQAAVEPFSITLAGAQHTGKTTFARNLASRLSRILDQEVVEYQSQDSFQESKICILNDVQTSSNSYSLDLHCLENLGGKGILINTTNVVRKRVPLYSFFLDWTLFKILITNNINFFKDFKFYLPPVYQKIFSNEGMYRRLGYPGLYYQSRNHIVDVTSVTSLYIEAQSGFTFLMDGKGYDNETLIPAVSDLLEKHRETAGVSCATTTRVERENSNWHVYIRAANPMEAVRMLNCGTLSSLMVSVPEGGKIALKNLSQLSGSAFNPELLTEVLVSIESFTTKARNFVTYLSKKMPKLNLVVEVGEIFFWTENGKVFTNHRQATTSYAEENDFIIFNDDLKTSIAKKVFVDYYLGTCKTIPIRQALLIDSLIQAADIPKSCESEIATGLEKEIESIKISRMETYLLDLKIAFKESILFKVILALSAGLALFAAGSLIHKTFSSAKTTKQGRRIRKSVGVSNTTGKRYLIRSSGVAYSGDEEFNEGVYADEMERLEDLEDDLYLGYQAAEITRSVKVDPDYFNRLSHELSDSKKGHGLKLILPRGTAYLNQKLKILKQGTSENFTFTCKREIQMDGLSDLLAFDNNIASFGFNSISSLTSYISSLNGPFVVLMRGLKTSNPLIGVPAQDFNLVMSGEVDYISTIVDGPINTNKMVNLDSGNVQAISLLELKEKPEGKIVGVKEFRSRRRRFFRVVSIPVSTQMIDTTYREESSLDQVTKKIRANAVRIRNSFGGLSGFFLCEGVVISPAHILEGTDVSDIVISEDSPQGLIEYRPYNCIVDEGHDICLFYIKGSKGHKDITSLLHRQEELSPPVPTLVVGLGSEPSIALSVRKPLRDIYLVDQDGMMAKEYIFTGSVPVHSHQTLTNNGDCGRPYINLGSDRPKIFALHVAIRGNALIGYRVDYDWVMKNITFKQSSLLRYNTPEFVEGPNLTLLGYSERTIKSPSKPYAKASPLSDYLSDIVPSLKQPAKTSIDQCSPEEIEQLGKDIWGKPDFYIGQIVQYNDPVSDFKDSSARDFVAGFCQQHHGKIKDNKVGQVTTLDEVLNGMQKIDDPLRFFSNPLNWNGSVGYDFRTKFPHVHAMGDLVEHRDGKAVLKNSREARYLLDKYLTHVDKGYRGEVEPDTLQDNLKQELRVNEKAFKQRVFTSYPKSLSMLMRHVTLRFATMLTKYHHTMPYKIGVNSASEWHVYASQMENFAGRGGLGFGFDLSRCDKHLSTQFFTKVLEPILIYAVRLEHNLSRCNCRHSLDEHLAMVSVVVEQLYHNVVASQDMLYEKRRGNSSGSDLTIVINSLYLDFILFAWFQNEARKSKAFPPTWEAYQRLVFRMLCGDDGKIIISRFGDNLNFKNFKSYMAEHGIGVDSPLKDGNEEPLTPMHEIPFISRGWVKTQRGLYIPKFKIEIISGLIYWTCKDEVEHLEDIVRQLSEFLVPYGPDIYATFYRGATEFIADHDGSYIIPTYQQALQEVERQVLGLALSQMNLSVYASPLDNQISKMVYITEKAEVALPVALLAAIATELEIMEEDSPKYRMLLTLLEEFLTAEAAPHSRPWGETFDIASLATENYPKAEAFLWELNLVAQGMIDQNNEPHFKWDFALHTVMSILSLLDGRMFYGNSDDEAQLQMERNPNQNVASMTQQANPGINSGLSTTMAANAPAMTVLPVEHLPQLASMLPPQGVETLVNTPINNTMADGPLIEARTCYLPTELMAYGGIVEDLKDIATGSYQVNEVLSVPVNTQQGTVVFKKMYGLDMLGGYTKNWVNLHERYAGPIQFKASIIANSITQGFLRIGYNQGENVNITIANSSKYGAVDFDLSKDNNDVYFTIRPNSDGKFFFRTQDPPSPDRGFIFGMLLTQLTNNFSEVGSIQIVISSRLHPEFTVANPIDFTAGPTPASDNSLQQAIVASGAPLDDTTLFIESRQYPKYPDLEANPTTVSLFADNLSKAQTSTRFLGAMTGVALGTNPIPSEVLNYGFTYTNRGPKVTDFVVSSMDPTPGTSARTTKMAVPNLEMHWSDTGSANPPDTIPATLLQSTLVKDGILHPFEQLTFTLDSSLAVNPTEGTYIPFIGNPSTPTQLKLTAVTLDTGLDQASLPSGYYSVDFASTMTPSASDGAIAQNLNLVPRARLGWIIWNWCRANCPTNGQIKITIADPTFSQTILEVLYRPKVGFLTTAAASQAFTFFNSNLAGYTFRTTTYSDQTPVTLNNDFSSFASMKAPNRFYRQMFNILGGGLAGFGQGMINQGNWKNNLDMQRMIGGQQLANIDAQGRWSNSNVRLTGRNQLRNTQLTGQNTLRNTMLQAQEQRNTAAFNMGLANLGNNMMASPQNNAAARASHPSYQRPQAIQDSGFLSVEGPGAYRVVGSINEPEHASTC